MFDKTGDFGFSFLWIRIGRIDVAAKYSYMNIPLLQFFSYVITKTCIVMPCAEIIIAYRFGKGQLNMPDAIGLYRIQYIQKRSSMTAPRLP